MDKERVKELIEKVWLIGYTDDNEGINECKQDMQYIEDYIDYLEGVEERYKEDISLFAALLNKVGVEYVTLTNKEIDENDALYTIMRFKDVGKVTVERHKPAKYYDEEDDDGKERD